MGIKFGREYKDIVEDLTDAVAQVEGSYELLEMEPQEWEELTDEERRDCLKTLADDIFYSLGADPELAVGEGAVRYDKEHHVLKVHHGEKLVSVIYLV
ncbi:hypothetical protein B5M42_014560 [Paenibacillus athensensis]|uniref:Uncharacterized protein n=1 Tax=Paenibacillus athensensis TaxID=1967502 RepID=A0A4Y8Q8J8_9BACL|nr:hypothetical protein [Paenibacillus athensensis]MCD1260033.1 hypothetical protein [Paenibacillus athensensis]